MKKLREWISSPKAVLPCFCVAVLLLLGSTIGGARAAIVYSGENYPAQISTSAVSVALVEENKGTPHKEYTGNSAEISDEAVQEKEALPELLQGMLDGEEKVKPGKKYTEQLGVKNTGETEQYVRVAVYRYWTGEDEETGKETKIRTASPDYINLHFAEADWERDEANSTAEREVFYYKKPLKAGETVYFVNGLTIDDAVLMETEGDTSVYGNLAFHVKVSVDAVQTHHAEDAILSAWGREVTVSDDGTLGLTE